VAIKFSFSTGFDGRLGWHSKQGAEQWYKDTLPGLWAGGPDLAEDNLEYFEISREVAAACLNGLAGSFLDE